ncbi:hypothetical protein ACU8KH_05484 [Lachancea thermotolerans]
MYCASKSQCIAKGDIMQHSQNIVQTVKISFKARAKIVFRSQEWLSSIENFAHTHICETKDRAKRFNSARFCGEK